MASLPVSALTDLHTLRTVLPVTEALGPAALSYLNAEDFRPHPAQDTVEMLRPSAQDLRALLASVSAEDADECGLDEITSPASVVRDGPRLVAAAGFCEWPGAVAHLGVLTATDARGRGLARQVASAAVARALDDGLLPQWRARPMPSRELARTLGFRELGAQLSIRVLDSAPS
ncbi:GNAT family N-acetyltransferase [Frankia nepalensis]|uniref:GNAT family N-acetyltransferase n=1 Tax=Frankia nepalensis TaxID=1836974 RepID=A0A937RLI4_9ACTN|nr:GNAT family N-acetyltransferase [Frankia nepalensis]MBL7632332.1 GNAT family N-acetyltransferase [Frankia nepalensis]